jgi:uncharacterized glyoxalase superfamily protein PhnB
MATKKKSKRPATRRLRKRAARPKRKQPETLRLRGIAPSFTVNDLERSIAWYRDVLGFTVGDRWEQEGQLMGVELEAGTTTFMLTQDDFAKGRDRKKGEGFRLYCQTVQDIDQLAAWIKAHGGTLDREPKDTPWESREFAVTDPDGFKLTIWREK